MLHDELNIISVFKEGSDEISLKNSLINVTTLIDALTYSRMKKMRMSRCRSKLKARLIFLFVIKGQIVNQKCFIGVPIFPRLEVK